MLEHLNRNVSTDYLVSRGLPFRDAYKISGSLVGRCIREGKTLDTLSLAEYREASPLIGEDVYTHIDLGVCVQKRTSEGGTSVQSVEKQLAAVRDALDT